MGPLSPTRAFLPGVTLAAAYGLLIYALGVSSAMAAVFSVVTVAFLAAVPFAVGFLTILPMREPSLAGSIVAPWASFLLILAICFVLRWEGTICIALALPWLLLFASLGGWFSRRVRDRQRRGQVAVSLSIVPFVLVPLETLLPLHDAKRATVTAIEIAAPPHVVWEYVVSVDTIREAERPRALYTTIGFPAAVAATLDQPRLGAIRRASFARNVVFTETITDWADAELLRFTIKANTREIPATSLDRHVTVGGEYFEVLSGMYELESLGDTATRLTLPSEYRVSTRLNWYSEWWARAVMRSVQASILRVLKTRSEGALASEEPMLTADMRELESALVAQAPPTLERARAGTSYQAMVLTGAREVEPAGTVMAFDTANQEAVDESLRVLLSSRVTRARTTAWLSASPPPNDAVNGAPALLRFEFEDRVGRCVGLKRPAAIGVDGGLQLGPRELSRCEGRVLTESIRRGRRLALTPLRVNSMEVIFTTVGDYPGRVEVYLDSVVVVVRGGTMRTKLLQGRDQTVDSISASLGFRTSGSWSTGSASNALVLEWRGTEGELKTLPRFVRFTIPRDSTESLTDRWVVFTHHLSVAKTADNPLGRAWTYAHAPDAMFRGISGVR